MKERLAGFLRVAVLTVAAVALVVGVAEASIATSAEECRYIPPFYLGACNDDNQTCIDMCDPYWPGQGVGACLPAPVCCICE